ncbi:MAG: beta-ribofuranosylaminobenzene 5'-phosphate synthase [Euryarchaeota archaeon]|nr:beta-ribofuranosylaminobenzene 5'-phosphate synthase [Euryarchaeota archaeon]
MIQVVTPSRLHITLIDLNGALGRIDGGVGLTLDYPSIRINAKKDAQLSVSGTTEFAERIKSAASAVLTQYNINGVAIDVVQEYPNHVGLGSGTQVALAVGTAISELYDLNLNPTTIAKLTGRGGTSGIGVAAYEFGGFLVDGGHKGKTEFLPSSASGKFGPGPIIARHDFPDWAIVLAIPNLRGASDKREIDVFQKQCPLPLNEVQELCHVILMEMLPAVVEHDIESFGRSINRVQTIGFKRRELELQPFCAHLVQFMRENGAIGAGMSSFGPVVYGITDGKRLLKAARSYLDDTIGGKVLAVKAQNTGAYVQEIVES